MFVIYLADHGSKLDWSFIQKQQGMFAYTCVTPEQVKRLKEEYAIYLPEDGRISLAGLNDHNLPYVTKSFHA